MIIELVRVIKLHCSSVPGHCSCINVQFESFMILLYTLGTKMFDTLWTEMFALGGLFMK